MVTEATLSTKIAIIETTILYIQQSLDRIEARMWSIMLGLVACVGATLISMVAKGLEWI